MTTPSSAQGRAPADPVDLLAGALRPRRLTVATAESCTGGLIAKLLTDRPGSSDYFLGGVVAYANEAKTELLGVPTALLEARGAVSPEVAEAMAAGARTRFGADLAVSTTGVAGPGGGSPEKPVGLVYLGLAGAAGSRSRRLDLAGDRDAVRSAAATAALRWLLEAAGEGG
jgi:nicotinamide-nucleotide amidase